MPQDQLFQHVFNHIADAYYAMEQRHGAVAFAALASLLASRAEAVSVDSTALWSDAQCDTPQVNRNTT